MEKTLETKLKVVNRHIWTLQSMDSLQQIVTRVKQFFVRDVPIQENAIPAQMGFTQDAQNTEEEEIFSKPKKVQKCQWDIVCRKLTHSLAALPMHWSIQLNLTSPNLVLLNLCLPWWSNEQATGARLWALAGSWRAQKSTTWLRRRRRGWADAAATWFYLSKHALVSRSRVLTSQEMPRDEGYIHRDPLKLNAIVVSL